jgi:hypothetical protein
MRRFAKQVDEGLFQHVRIGAHSETVAHDGVNPVRHHR